MSRTRKPLNVIDIDNDDDIIIQSKLDGPGAGSGADRRFNTEEDRFLYSQERADTQETRSVYAYEDFGRGQAEVRAGKPALAAVGTDYEARTSNENQASGNPTED